MGPLVVTLDLVVEYHTQLTIFCSTSDKDLTLLFEFFNCLRRFLPRILQCSHGETPTLAGMSLNLSEKCRLRADIIVVLRDRLC
jgi:hypothetical protein